jgi:hypothetical protein
MEQISSTLGPALLKQLLVQRAELRESISALEYALAAPSTRSRQHWAERVHVALVELSADLRAHVDITEGPSGLYRELLRAAPRLSGPVARLTREHVLITAQVNDLLTRLDGPEADHDVDPVRAMGTALLGTLIRHRQRGSDLVYEAYQVDVGGEN